VRRRSAWSSTTLQVDGSRTEDRREPWQVPTAPETADEELPQAVTRWQKCGFCTPGILMSLTALFARAPAPNTEVGEIRETVGGHLRARC